MFFWKKKGKKYLHIWGVALFILKLKNWKADVTILNMCTFVWIHFDLVGLNGTLFGCECVIGLSPNPFSFGNSCLMIYNMWLHFQVWFRMAWNSIYFEKTIPFVPCMKYDFCAFFSPSIIRRFFEQEAWPELRHATSCWAIKLLDLITH